MSHIREGTQANMIDCFLSAHLLQKRGIGALVRKSIQLEVLKYLLTKTEADKTRLHGDLNEYGEVV